MVRKKKVAVIFGGKSTEHEVSLKSATSVINNIDQEKIDLVLIGITKKGQWLLYDGPVSEISTGKWEDIAKKDASNRKITQHHENSVRNIFYAIGAETNEHPIDVVFPVVHGNNCEDGTLQGLLELSEIPYVGPGVLASSVGMDKVFAKIMFEKANIPTCKYLYFTRNDMDKNQQEILTNVEQKLGYPCFVKPANAGSSVGVTKAYNAKELKKAISVAAQYDKKIMIEDFVDGREIECAVLGNENPKASVVGEAISGGDFYDYDMKYNSNTSKTEIPAQIDKEKSDLIREYAKKAFLALGCESLSRVDFFLHRKTGEILINEINTLPGFTSISMYPKMWEATGVSYSDLINKLLDLAIQCFEYRKKNKTSN